MDTKMEHFDVRVHFDGAFCFQPLRYENGEVKKVALPRLGFEAFKHFMVSQVENPFHAIYYKIVDCELDNGLMMIGNENDLLSYYDITKEYGVMELYIDHFNVDLTHYLQGSSGKVIDDPPLTSAPLEKGKGVVEQETDSEYEEYDDEGSETSDAPSLDHLSEGEDELAEVRMKKKSNKPKDYFDVKQSMLEEEDAYNPQVEHDCFIEGLLKNIQLESHGGAYEDVADENKKEEEFPVFDPETHWRLQKPKVGERYESHYQLKECIRYYALNGGYSIWYERSSNDKLIARCGQRPPRLSTPESGKKSKQKQFPAVDKSDVQKCVWRCFAKKMENEDSFQVISLKDEHTCSRNFRYGSLINYKFIARQFARQIRANPNITLSELSELVLRKFKCHVTLPQCSRARHYAVNQLEQSLVEHYGMLRPYAEEILRSNPGSTVRLDVTVNPDEKTYFDRFYVCFKGLKEGWKKGCRRVLALDGCFLKTSCQGELLTAVGRDGNNHIYPVAWAVVGVENKNNWIWFLDLLKQDLELGDGQGLTLLSDQHKV